jgi:hypothetical protein
VQCGIAEPDSGSERVARHVNWIICGVAVFGLFLFRQKVSECGINTTPRFAALLERSRRFRKVSSLFVAAVQIWARRQYECSFSLSFDDH